MSYFSGDLARAIKNVLSALQDLDDAHRSHIYTRIGDASDALERAEHIFINVLGDAMKDFSEAEKGEEGR